MEGLESKFVNSDKLLIFFQSAAKGSLDLINKKEKWITFVGKLNKAKGYDVFASSIKKVLNKYPDWRQKSLVMKKERKLF